MNDSNPPKPKLRWCQFSLKATRGFLSKTVTSLKPKRRWFQYSLRTLFGVVLLLSLLLSWLAWQREQERRAATELRKRDGHVIYEYHPLSRSRLVRNLLGRDFLSKVDQVSFYPTRKIDDAGLRYIEQLNGAKNVGLSETRITDAGLVHLRGMKSIKILSLSRTLVTDTGLEYLGRLNSLVFLDLSHTQITDAGLQHLERLNELRTLSLEGTQTTKEGVKKLQQALPNCHIYH